MTTIGVTERLGSYNRTNEGHDWKRRAERLVRASGQAYTIVRPGWFDYNAPDQQRIVILQGGRHHSGTPQDGIIAHHKVAKALVGSLTSEAASRKTFKLVAEKGVAQDCLEPLSPLSMRMRTVHSMQSAISTICHSKTNRNMSATILQKCLHTELADMAERK